MKRRILSAWKLWLILLLIAFTTFNVLRAQAFVVPDLPGDNLVNNAWFNNGSNTSIASLEGWTNVLKNGVGWGPSDKDQNPSPYSETGTSARWAEINETVYPNVDVYLYQIIEADSSHKNLKFSTWWVSHRIDILEYTVFGGSSSNGPWTKVWTPFSVSVDVEERPESGNKDDLWKNTGIMETTISTGYAFYKLEIHARYPEPLTTTGSQGVGVKVTGVYFATQSTVAATATPEPAATSTRGSGATSTPTKLPTSTPTSAPTNTPTSVPTRTPDSSGRPGND